MSSSKRKNSYAYRRGLAAGKIHRASDPTPVNPYSQYSVKWTRWNSGYNEGRKQSNDGWLAINPIQ